MEREKRREKQMFKKRKRKCKANQNDDHGWIYSLIIRLEWWLLLFFLYKYVYENLAQKGMKLMYDNDDDDNDVKQWLISFSS